jgi:hypothetical protein
MITVDQTKIHDDLVAVVSDMRARVRVDVAIFVAAKAVVERDGVMEWPCGRRRGGVQ